MLQGHLIYQIMQPENKNKTPEALLRINTLMYTTAAAISYLASLTEDTQTLFTLQHQHNMHVQLLKKLIFDTF